MDYCLLNAASLFFASSTSALLGVSVFPEVEEFLVMLYGDGFLAFVLLFIDY